MNLPEVLARSSRRLLALTLLAAALGGCSDDKITGTAARESPEYPGFVEVQPSDDWASPNIRQNSYFPPGNSYQLHGLVIEEGAIARIGAGVSLRIDGSITCRGTLIVTGTADNPVTIQANGPQGIWMSFTGAEEPSTLTHCWINRVNDLKIEQAQLELEECRVDSVRAIYVTGGTALLRGVAPLHVGYISCSGSILAAHACSVEVRQVDMYGSRFESAGSSFLFQGSKGHYGPLTMSGVSMLSVRNSSWRAVEQWTRWRVGAPARIDMRSSSFERCGFEFTGLAGSPIEDCTWREGGLSVNSCIGLRMCRTVLATAYLSLYRSEVACLHCDLIDSDVNVRDGWMRMANCLVRVSEGSEFLVRLYHPDSRVDLNNCSLVSTAGPGRVSLLSEEPAELTVRNSIVWREGQSWAGDASGCSFLFCDLDSLFLRNALRSFLTECFSSDPLFADTTTYRLNEVSPCRDRGDWRPEWRDPDGTRNDLGIYGGPDAR